jgi:hypothetical protein
MIAPDPSRRVDSAAAAEIDRLITVHSDAIEMNDLPWLGGILSHLRADHVLTPAQISRISLIRGNLARQYHRHGGHAGMRRDCDGAA